MKCFNLAKNWWKMLLVSAVIVFILLNLDNFIARFDDLNNQMEPLHSHVNAEIVEGKTIIFNDLCMGESIKLRENTPRKKVLGYSMFGRDALKKYGNDVKAIAKESVESKFYKTWHVWVYHEGDITPEFEAETKKINSLLRFCDVRKVSPVIKKDVQNLNGMSWRFIPMGDLTVDIACSRDLDSPLLLREQDAVGEWLKSDKIFHVMRDNIVHTSAVMGGLWCFRNSKNRQFGKELLDKVLGKIQRRDSASKRESGKGDDQNVMNVIVWPSVNADAMHHDAFLCGMYKGATPYPTQRNKTMTFVGCLRPCVNGRLVKCSMNCRPANHKDWEYC